MPDSLLQYIEFSVVINTADVYVDTAREWFLRSQSILKATDHVVEQFEEPTPVIAGVHLEDQVRIFAQPRLFQVVHYGEHLTRESNRPVDLMLRYLDVVPITRCSGVGINFKGALLTPAAPNRQRPLHQLFTYGARWANHNATAPAITINASYPNGNRQINISMEDVESVDKPLNKGVLFTGNVHHAIPASTTGTVNRLLASKIKVWEQDMDDFEAIVEKYKSRLVKS